MQGARDVNATPLITARSSKFQYLVQIRQLQDLIILYSGHLDTSKKSVDVSSFYIGPQGCIVVGPNIKLETTTDFFEVSW